MVDLSNLAPFRGLQYYGMHLSSGAQTSRPGWAGPVSAQLGGDGLTGCLFLQLQALVVILQSASDPVRI